MYPQDYTLRSLLRRFILTAVGNNTLSINDGTLDDLWWSTKGKDKTLEAVKADFNTIKTDNQRYDRYTTYERIYRNEDIQESDTLAAELLTYGSELSEYTRSSYNLVATVTDNIVSRIIRSKPRAIYQVDGGNWSLRRQTKMQQKWIDYVAHSQFFPRFARDQARDAVLLGNGYTKIYKKPGVDEIGICNVHPSDIFVDQVEATYGQPQRMFQRMFTSKDYACRAFPEHKKAIKESGILSESDFQNRQQWVKGPILEQTEIVEAWHLPTWVDHDGKTSGDGRHLIFVGTALLVDEEWKRDDFPILNLKWKSRPSDTHHGLSVPEEILSIHLDMNFTLQQIHETAEITASPFWTIPQGCNVSTDEVSNLPGMQLEFTGATPPAMMQPPKVQMDMLAFLNSQEERAYRRLGLDSSTPNQPSPGLETGRAVRMDFDARSMAFAGALQNWEELYKDFGDKVMAVGRQIWEKNKSFTIIVPRNKNTTSEVNWSEVNVNPRKDSYIIKVSAGSSLSQHPAGRIDDVKNLVDIGAVTDKSEKRALIDLPDIEHSNDLDEAARDAVEFMCEEMLDEGNAYIPEPYDDLDLCLTVANSWYLKARTQGAPEPNLQLMRDFLDRTIALIEKREQSIAEKQAAVQAGQQPLPAPAATPPAADGLGQNPAAIGGGLDPSLLLQ